VLTLTGNTSSKLPSSRALPFVALKVSGPAPNDVAETMGGHGMFHFVKGKIKTQTHAMTDLLERKWLQGL
jgi:hypothetical protein